MSIQTEIERLTQAKDTFKAKGVELKIIEGTETLDGIADAYNGIVNRGGVTAQVEEGETYTIEKGYHDGTGTVSGVAGGGSYNLQSKKVTPTKMQQQVTPDGGYYGLSDVTVEAIPANYQDVSSVNATADDVLTPKIIVTADGKAMAGTMPDNGAVSEKLSAQKKSYTVPKGYHSGVGTVSVDTETKMATPTESSQEITPTEGKLLEQVTVEAIPAKYKDTTPVTTTPEHVLEGDIYVDGTGQQTGTMKNNGAVEGTIDGLSQTEYTVPKGYHDGLGKVSLTSAIEDALATI